MSFKARWYRDKFAKKREKAFAAIQSRQWPSMAQTTSAQRKSRWESFRAKVVNLIRSKGGSPKRRTCEPIHK